MQNTPRLKLCIFESPGKVFILSSDQYSSILKVGDLETVYLEFRFISHLDIVECVEQLEKLDVGFFTCYSNYDFEDSSISNSIKVLLRAFNEFDNLKLLTLHISFIHFPILFGPIEGELIALAAPDIVVSSHGISRITVARRNPLQ